MKQFCSLFLLFLGFTSLSIAQKVQYKKDQVTVDGKPYCLMTSKGVIVKDYTVKTLDGKKIATMKPEMIDNGQQNAPSDGYFLITFWESGQQCEFDMARFSPGSRLADDLVEAGVLVDGNYSEEGEKRFLNLHKRKYSDDIRSKLSKSNIVVKVENNRSGRKSDDDSENTTDKPKNNSQLVKRNREGDIDVWASKEIKQDFKKIGTYSETRDGMKVVISIFLPDGKKVAKAVFEDSFAQKGDMTTFSDDKEHVIKVIKMSSTSDWAKAMAVYLVDRDYL